MAVNKRKILDAARKYAQKGAKDRALKEYEKLLALDRRDAKLRLEIGDAYRRWGQVDEAIDTYTKVAEQYTSEGFDARAVAVYKQIQNLDAEHTAIYGPLAELYQRMGLASEAVNALQTAADFHYRSGQKREALDLLRKMATVDPSNTTSRIKVADLLVQEGLNEEAVAEYDEIVRELERQGEIEAAAGLYERILEIEPNRVATLAAFSRNLHASGHDDRAEPLMKRAIKAQPDEPELYEQLAEVYRAQQREEDMADVYRRLAEVYRARGDEEHAREIMQRFVPIDHLSGGTTKPPLDPEEQLMIDAAIGGNSPSLLSGDVLGAGEDLVLESHTVVEIGEPDGFDLGASDDSMSGSQAGFDSERDSDPLGESGLDLSGLDVDEIDLAGIQVEEDEAPGLIPEVGEPTPTAPLPEGEPEQLLAEASVYLRYGKQQQAIANLEAVVAQQPDNRPALEKLGEAFNANGDPQHAIESWLRAAALAHDAADIDAIGVLRGRIGALDEAAAAQLDIAMEALTPTPAKGAAIPASREIDLDDDAPLTSDMGIGTGGEIDLEFDFDMDGAVGEELGDVTANDATSEESAPVLEISTPMPIENEDSATGDPGVSSTTSQQIAEDLEEAEFYIQQGLNDEAEAIYQRVLALAPNHPQALVRLGEIAASRGQDPGSSSAALDVVTGGASAAAGVSVSTEAPVSSGVALEDAGFVDWNDDADSVMGSAAGGDPVPIEIEAPPDGSLPAHALGGSAALGEPDDAAAADLHIDPSISLTDDDDNGITGATIAGPEARAALSPLAPAAPRTAPLESAVTAPVGLGPLPADKPLDPRTDTLDVPAVPAVPDDAIATGSDEHPTPATSLVPAAADPQPEAASAAPPTEHITEPEYDLAAELSEALDDGPGASASGTADGDDAYAAYFRDFKKGVSETLTEGDHQAHYDLGIAYREMGLVDDAIAEFHVTMTSGGRELECLHMLGLCAIDQNDPQLAVGHFERLLVAPGATGEQQIAARFELGRAFELLGDREGARAAWEAVSALDAGFCDVTNRLAALDEPEKPEAVVEADEEYESFAGLVAEANADELPVGETFADLIEEVTAEDAAEAAAPPAPPAPEASPETPTPNAAKPRKKKKISFV